MSAKRAVLRYVPGLYNRMCKMFCVCDSLHVVIFLIERTDILRNQRHWVNCEVCSLEVKIFSHSLLGQRIDKHAEYTQIIELRILIQISQCLLISDQFFKFLLQVLDWFVQISLAIKHVHDRKILHRDIKTQVCDCTICYIAVNVCPK